MYQSGHYLGLDREAIGRLIREDGFDPRSIEDRAGYSYALHQHAETKLLAFLAGSMDVTVRGEVFHCVAGDRLLIEGDVPHSAQVGADGCVYYWSEKL